MDVNLTITYELTEANKRSTIKTEGNSLAAVAVLKSVIERIERYEKAFDGNT